VPNAVYAWRPVPIPELAGLVYELLDAHDDTAYLARALKADPSAARISGICGRCSASDARQSLKRAGRRPKDGGVVLTFS
jgi:hypothetical protein